MHRRDFLSLSLGLATGLGVAPVAAKPLQFYQPTRFLFVGDRSTYGISVIDLQTGEPITRLHFHMVPKVLEIARDDAMMVVGNPEVSHLYLYDLRGLSRRRVDLPSPLYQAFFVPQSNLLALGLRDQVGLLNYRTGQLSLFEERFDSPQRQTALYAYYTLLFSAFSKTFWVLDKTQPHIYYKSAEMPEAPWQTLDLSEKVQGGLDKGVASPEDYLLAFNTLDGQQGFIYFPENGRLLSTGPMYTVGSTYRPMVTPYIDAYSRHVAFADVSGHVALFDLAHSEQAQRFTLDFSPRQIRTGWLESTLIIGGDKGLRFQSFADPNDAVTFRFPYEVVDMWVTGDSKTLLVVVDEGPAQVLRYDIRTRQALPPLPVSGIVMGARLRMGSNNSICY